MKILVTGAAGFIGFHVAKALLEKGVTVVGIDNLNSYYSVELKEARLQQLSQFPSFHFYKADISDPISVEKMWKKEGDILQVIHLAAQAGVRYSLEDPYTYVSSNLIGFSVILEQCRHQNNFKHLLYASTSSVYGSNDVLPFTEDQQTDNPVSFYAATKKANEIMAQSYYQLYKIKMTGLRFFTVYGPWGRPDMALFKFTKAILNDDAIEVYNDGSMARDYTFIDDITQGILSVLDRKNLTEWPKHHIIYNLGNQTSIFLKEFIETIEKVLGKKAVKSYLPLQLGDVIETYSSIEKATKDFGYMPQINIQEGVACFVEWYRSFYKV